MSEESKYAVAMACVVDKRTIAIVTVIEAGSLDEALAQAVREEGIYAGRMLADIAIEEIDED